MKIMSVVGARPNFMKIAPVISALKELDEAGAGLSHMLVHTGQHYDAALSESFFRDLALPSPDAFLGVGSASHAVQTAEVMKGFEAVVLREKPDIIIVIGDVNSTLACALVASKLVFDGRRPRIAHIESGLRSFDMSMPEEVNRILTDHISDMLFVTEESALVNLRQEGIPEDRIFFVGNTMIDTLLSFRAKAQKSDVLNRLGLAHGEGGRPLVPYGLLTLHRPSNVDEKEVFLEIIEGLKGVASEMPVIFPIHPRTRRKIEEFGLSSGFQFTNGAEIKERPTHGIVVTEPLGYIDFLCLMMNSRIVLTDSGGIQEETTCLGVPCVTIRENTERPVTIREGTNVLAGTASKGIADAVERQLRAKVSTKSPEKWDGLAAKRIAGIISAISREGR